MNTKQPLLIIVALLILCLSSFATSVAIETTTEKVEPSQQEIDSSNLTQYEVTTKIYQEAGINPDLIILIDWYSLKPKPDKDIEDFDEMHYSFTHKMFCRDIFPGDANLIMSNYVSKRAVLDQLRSDADITEQEHSRLVRVLDDFSVSLATKARMEFLLVDTHKKLGSKYDNRHTMKLHFVRGSPNYHGKNFKYSLSAEHLF